MKFFPQIQITTKEKVLFHTVCCDLLYDSECAENLNIVYSFISNILAASKAPELPSVSW